MEPSISVEEPGDRTNMRLARLRDHLAENIPLNPSSQVCVAFTNAVSGKESHSLGLTNLAPFGWPQDGADCDPVHAPQSPTVRSLACRNSAKKVPRGPVLRP